MLCAADVGEATGGEVLVKELPDTGGWKALGPRNSLCDRSGRAHESKWGSGWRWREARSEWQRTSGVCGTQSGRFWGKGERN